MTALDRILQRWRIRKALPLVPPGARVLDVGCSDGALFRAAGERIAPSVGIDPVAPMEGELGPHRIVRSSFPGGPEPDGPFDAITMLATLEHLPDDDLRPAADSCHRLLRSGGRLIVTVPSPLVDAILVVLQRTRLVEGMATEQHHGFRPDRVAPLFAGAGFRLLVHRRFQLGLNNLFAFERP